MTDDNLIDISVCTVHDADIVQGCEVCEQEMTAYSRQIDAYAKSIQASANSIERMGAGVDPMALAAMRTDLLLEACLGDRDRARFEMEYGRRSDVMLKQANAEMMKQRLMADNAKGLIKPPGT